MSSGGYACSRIKQAQRLSTRVVFRARAASANSSKSQRLSQRRSRTGSSVRRHVGRKSGASSRLRAGRRRGSTDATVLNPRRVRYRKELLAQAIHNRGRRAHGPFVRVNCQCDPTGGVRSESSAIVAGHSPVRCATRPGRFHSPTAEQSFSMKSVSCHSTCSPNCCGVLQDASTSQSRGCGAEGGCARGSPPPTSICAKRRALVDFAGSVYRSTFSTRVAASPSQER